MTFFNKTVYANLIEQKFSIPSNLISNRIKFEIKFEGIENLSDELVLKSFYFFVLLFNKTPTFESFSSRYHLGKTFYSFNILLSFRMFSFFHFISNIFNFNIAEPHKINFISSLYGNNLFLKLVDLKIFHVVESNPHFFKWDKELFVYCVPYIKFKNFSEEKFLNLYFWDLENLKIIKFNNFWNFYVS